MKLTLTYTGFAAAWAGMLVFDLLVFCMTIYKSMLLPRPNGTNILGILIRDGELLAHPLIFIGSNNYIRHDLLWVGSTFLTFGLRPEPTCAQGNGGV